MKKSIELLIKLQEEIDAEKRLLKENADIPVTIEKLKNKLDTVTRNLDTVKQKEKQNLSHRINQEEEIKLAESKKIKLNEQLMNVKDNVQYKATVKEIKFLEQSVVKTEENILILMEEDDALKGKLESAKTEFAEQETKLNTEEKALLTKSEDNEKKIQDIMANQHDMRKQIEPELLSRFDILASKKPWIGISGVKEDTICSICRFKVRPQVMAELISEEEIHSCDNCQRILYYIPSEVD